MVCPISFSNQNFRVFHVNGKGHSTLYMAKKEGESVGSSGYCPYTKGLSSQTSLCYQNNNNNNNNNNYY